MLNLFVYIISFHEEVYKYSGSLQLKVIVDEG
ncbi:unnamed protein product [Commensalibacter papalotli (ex Botero et al. 2024)]|uniref:Uncharacterized protein n=1 Tax=Commensalibacter papalotli (ex Botero et al. 2024) TaxID=2972766 RepID=A0ABM9HQ23_9PROT|nr:unnamed protein product [Commensalibacter papalotli (ex Botero et al. 2024)]